MVIHYSWSSINLSQIFFSYADLGIEISQKCCDFSIFYKTLLCFALKLWANTSHQIQIYWTDIEKHVCHLLKVKCPLSLQWVSDNPKIPDDFFLFSIAFNLLVFSWPRMFDVPILSMLQIVIRDALSMASGITMARSPFVCIRVGILEKKQKVWTWTQDRTMVSPVWY